MIQVQGKNHLWVVYSAAGEPVSDEAIEQAITQINETPVHTYILGGFVETETTFEKIDSLLTPLREIGMTPGDFGVLVSIGTDSQVLLLPEDDFTDIPSTEIIP